VCSVKCVGWKVCGLGFMVWGLGFSFWVQGFGFSFWVCDFGLGVGVQDCGLGFKDFALGNGVREVCRYLEGDDEAWSGVDRSPTVAIRGISPLYLVGFRN